MDAATIMDSRGVNLEAGANRGGHVYRITSKAKVFDLFTSAENVLVAPHKWEDPFEDFLARGQGAPRHGWFGQCWTRNQASDAMWRIYSPDKGGIRLRTTPTKLAAAHSQAGQVFLDKVAYYREADIRKCLENNVGMGNSPKDVAKTLLVERLAFRHEGEVRLLIHAPSHADSDFLRQPLDPHELIDQMLIDPRLTTKESAALMREIRSETAFGGAIKQSALYAAPEIRWPWLGQNAI